MIPAICLLIFSIMGTWMMIDPLPSYFIRNFPEIIGRFLVALHYWIATYPPFVEAFVRIAPRTAMIRYFILIGEIQDMAELPLGADYETFDD